MTLIKLLFVLACSVEVALPDAGTVISFGTSDGRIKANADYMRALGEYWRNIGEARLAWARANLTDAQA